RSDVNLGLSVLDCRREGLAGHDGGAQGGGGNGRAGHGGCTDEAAATEATLLQRFGIVLALVTHGGVAPYRFHTQVRRPVSSGAPAGGHSGFHHLHYGDQCRFGRGLLVAFLALVLVHQRRTLVLV